MSPDFAYETAVFHLDDSGAIGVGAKADVLGADRGRPELMSGRLVTVFAYAADWDFRERHPDGDELVVVLQGEIDLVLDQGAGEHAVRVGQGRASVIPAGAWHRIAVHEPATLLFVTPVPARTEHEWLAATGGRKLT